MSGVTIECNNLQSVSEITALIFGNDFFELVTSQTNLYHQQNEKSYKNYDKALKWSDVTSSNMKFLGLIILIAQIRKSHWAPLWAGRTWRSHPLGCSPAPAPVSTYDARSVEPVYVPQ